MRLLFLIPLLLAACSTTIYSPKTGKAIFRTYANASQISIVIDGEKITLGATNLDHAYPTAVAFHGTAHVIGNAGLAATSVASMLGPGKLATTLLPVVGTSASVYKPAPTPLPLH